MEWESTEGVKTVVKIEQIRKFEKKMGSSFRLTALTENLKVNGIFM